MAPSEAVAAKVMAIVYGVFVGLVLAERASHLGGIGSGVMAELRAALERQRAASLVEQDYRRSRLKMAYEVWEATGQRVDRA